MLVTPDTLNGEGAEGCVEQTCCDYKSKDGLMGHLAPRLSG